MRNIRFSQGARLYDDGAKAHVRALQERLTELGCDPGPVDGLMGARTREAAKTCRAFAEGGVPDEVNAMTVEAWRAAYDAIR